MGPIAIILSLLYSFFPPVGSFGKEQTKISGSFLVLAYISSEYVLVFFGWEPLLQPLGPPPTLQYSHVEKLEWPQLFCVHKDVSFGPLAVLLTFQFGVAAYVLET